jgi:predicted  nucleic acid-binding Zn-ribbon protein
MLTLSGTVTLTTRTELLWIAVAAGRMGIEGTKNLSAFVKLVDALSVSTNLMGENAATSIARILEVAGEAQSNVTGVASAINALSNSVAATESEIVHFVLRLQSQYEKQNRAADRWIEKLSDTNGATEQMAAQAERAMSSYKLLGSEKLAALRSAIGSIRAETESLKQSLSATLSSLKDELDSLDNNQLSIETRAYQAQLASL